MIDKLKFYEQLKPFANKYLPIHFFLNFGDQLQYCLVFSWTSTTPDGKFNPIMYAQLYDNRISGSKKYITNELVWDCRVKKTTTEHRLYMFLDKWVTEAIRAKYQEVSP